MQPHYFNQKTADEDDHLLSMAKEQGYVPKTCLLGGAVVIAEINDGRSPCDGCFGPRNVCKGRPLRIERGRT